jgi:PAS domain S-box-containing protein
MSTSLDITNNLINSFAEDLYRRKDLQPDTKPPNSPYSLRPEITLGDFVGHKLAPAKGASPPSIGGPGGPQYTFWQTPLRDARSYNQGGLGFCLKYAAFRGLWQPNMSRFRTRLDSSLPARDQGFGRLFTVSLIWPLVLMAVLAGLLILQVKLLIVDAQALNNTNQLLTQFSNTQKLFIDLETGVRGYQITGNPIFLEPYREAQQLVNPALEQLSKQIGEETPLEETQIKQLQNRYEQWERFAKEASLARQKGDNSRILALSTAGKKQMDLIRSSFATMEAQVRNQGIQRTQKIERNVPFTLAIIICTFLGGATVLAFLSRRQLVDLAVQYEQLIASDRARREKGEIGEARYRSLVEAISEIVWTAQADGSVATHMDDWGAFTGQSFHEYKGWGWLNVIHPEDQERTRSVWTEAVREQKLFAIEHRLRRYDGVYRYMRGRGVPIYKKDGEVLEWIGIHTDIDEQKRGEEALTQRAAELARVSDSLRATASRLEERNRELVQFNYVVSHDLKAPLRAIGTLSEWIEEDLQGQLSDESQRNMNLLRGRIYRLEALINGLLKYSRLGNSKLNFELVPVADLLTEVIASLNPPSGFTFTVEPPMPTVNTDRTLLGQVFTDLIDNAIMHRPYPQGQVQVTAVEEEHFYQFAVSDDGPGIDERFYKKIFIIFQTLEPRDERESTGIGLAFVKRIVERQGGQIWVESKVGKGSTFFFTWPKQPVESEDSILPISN